MTDKKEEIKNKLQVAVEYCHSLGVTFSIQRKNVLQQLMITNAFVDAEALWFLVMDQGHDISLASVYNSLRWLEKHGFVEKGRKGKKGIFKYKNL